MSWKCQKIFDSVERSRAKIQLLLFFHNNPFISDDLEGISIWVGMHEEEITSEIEELCQMELLILHRTSTHSYYRFTEKPDLVKAVHNLIERHYSKRL